MELYARGQVVSLAFPFSDFSKSKLRPVLLIASIEHGDWIVSQITSNPYNDDLAIELSRHEFESGGLPHTSYLRPGKLFTANNSLMGRPVGAINAHTLSRILSAIVLIIEPQQ